MSQSTIAPIAHSVASTAKTSRGEVQLRGPWLRIIQGIWLVLVVIDLATLVINLPIYYHELFTVCPGPITSCQLTDQLNLQVLATLQHAGFSLNTYALYVIFLDLLTTLSFLLLGALIIWRRANTWMGLFVSFLLITIGSLGPSLSHANGFPNASSNLLLNILNSAGAIPMLLYYPCLSFFFSTFPDGRFVPRWSWALIVLWVVNFVFWTAPTNTPFNLTNWLPLLEAGWLSLVFGGSVCIQLYRFLWAATPIQRQQIKWLIYGFMPVIILPLFLTLSMTFVPALNKPGAYLVNTPNSFLLIITIPLYRFYYLPVPFCVGIALLRYRLWDIDRVINRTLVYGLLTTILLTIYLLLVFGGQSLLASFFGPGNPVVLVVSTLIVAALFQPLRIGLQSIVDRRFYRSKYDAQKTLESFSATLRGEVDLAQLCEQLISVVEETMQPMYISLWIYPLKQQKSEEASLKSDK